MAKIIDNYILLEQIGSGSSSDIYKAKHLDGDEEVAIKVIKLNSFMGQPNLREALVNEIQLLKKSKFTDFHPKVIKMLKSSNHIYLVFDLIIGKSLKEIIEHDDYTTNELMDHFTKVLTCVKGINDAGIIHNGLLPKSIFMTENVCKVINFKFHKRILSEEEPKFQNESFYSSKDKILSVKSDAFSLGMVLLSLLVKKELNEEILGLLETNEIWSLYSIEDSLKDLIILMTDPDPKERISISQAIKIIQSLRTKKCKTVPLQENINFMNITSNTKNRNFSSDSKEEGKSRLNEIDKIMDQRNEINEIFPFLKSIYSHPQLPQPINRFVEILVIRFLYSAQELMIQNTRMINSVKLELQDRILEALIEEHQEFANKHEKKLYDVSSNEMIIRQIYNFFKRNLNPSQNDSNALKEEEIYEIFNVAKILFKNSTNQILNFKNSKRSNISSTSLEQMRIEFLNFENN